MTGRPVTPQNDPTPPPGKPFRLLGIGGEIAVFTTIVQELRGHIVDDLELISPLFDHCSDEPLILGSHEAGNLIQIDRDRSERVAHNRRKPRGEDCVNLNEAAVAFPPNTCLGKTDDATQIPWDARPAARAANCQDAVLKGADAFGEHEISNVQIDPRRGTLQIQFETATLLKRRPPENHFVAFDSQKPVFSAFPILLAPTESFSL